MLRRYDDLIHRPSGALKPVAQGDRLRGWFFHSAMLEFA